MFMQIYNQKKHTTRLLTWAEIDLDAMAHNVKAIRAHIGAHVALMAVVKANAYGHGALPVAKTALRAGADWLAVNRVAEGVQLRQAGIKARILVLGYCLPEQARLVVEHALTPTVTTLETAYALANQLSSQEPPFAIHLKIDTGMGRLGLLPSEVANFAAALRQMPMLNVEGVFSHLAVADEASTTFNLAQFQAYKAAIDTIQATGIEPSIQHIANSAATMAYPNMHQQLVRLGIALYGLYPSDELNWPVSLTLKPAMTLKTRVARLRTLPANASVGYGRTFIAQTPTPIALAPVGYGDGYPRLCSNRGAMLVGGQRAPIAGRVSMDQTSLDVTGIEGITENDEVVVFGKQGNAVITVEEVATWAETINYEIVTRLTARVPRVYIGG